MPGLIPVVILIAAGCGGFYYWLSRHGLAAEQRENPQDRRRVSLLTEGVGYLGAALVLIGAGVAMGQSWRDFTDWGHVTTFAGIALLFLAIGLAVLRIAEHAIRRMIAVVWFVSAGCAAAAAGIAAHDVYGSPGATTAAVIGITIMVYSGLLWLVQRLELQLIATFIGLTIAVSAEFVTLAGKTGPWLSIALGLWALGIGWVIVGRQYPEPLWSTVPLGTVIALIGPSFAVWQHGWVFAISIGTAATAMLISVRIRSITLLAAAAFALFGYITTAVVRYFHVSLGVPWTLAVSGVLLLIVTVVMAWLRPERKSEPIHAEHLVQEPRKRVGTEHEHLEAGHLAKARRTHPDDRRPAVGGGTGKPEPDQGVVGETRRERNGPQQDRTERSESPNLDLAKAS